MPDVAFLGCAHPHVPALLAVVAGEPSLRLAAVWDADPSAIPLALDGLAVRSPDAAIRRAELVVVCAPTDLRPALTVQAARDGRPVLVAGPVARSAAEADRLAREVTRTRTPAAAALFLRELPALDRLAGLLRERLLGRLASVTAAFTHPRALDGPLRWMREPARAGVGGFGDLALHLLDALAALPAADPPRLSAVALDRPGRAGGDVGGIGLGTWAGVPLAMRAGWAARPGGLRIELAGATGTATLRGGTLELVRDGRPERWIGAPPDPGDALRAFAARAHARRLRPDGLVAAAQAQARLERAVPVA